MRIRVGVRVDAQTRSIIEGCYLFRALVLRVITPPGEAAGEGLDCVDDRVNYF